MVNAWFGIKPPDDYDGPAWGARAIFDQEPDEFSFVWDRKQGQGGCKPLFRWLEKSGIPLLRTMMRHEGYSKRSSHRLVVTSEGYTLSANANGSCGYLYLGCWEDRDGNS